MKYNDLWWDGLYTRTGDKIVFADLGSRREPSYIQVITPFFYPSLQEWSFWSCPQGLEVRFLDCFLGPVLHVELA
jgi:hypothetical protein